MKRQMPDGTYKDLGPGGGHPRRKRRRDASFKIPMLDDMEQLMSDEILKRRIAHRR